METTHAASNNANEATSHPPHPATGRFWPILQNSNYAELQHLALARLQAQSVFETKTRSCAVSPHIYMTKCCNTHMWAGAGRMHSTSDLWRDFSGSAPCRICCLSWSTAFSSHIKDFTHLKQSWHLQCESYLKGVRFNIPNWSLSDILTSRLQLHLCLSPEYPYISPEVQLFSKSPSYKSDTDLLWLTYRYRKNGFLAFLLVLLLYASHAEELSTFNFFYCPHYSWSVDSCMWQETANILDERG